MNILTKDPITGKIREASHVEIATNLIMASRVKPWWVVIGMIVDAYKKLYKEEYREFVKMNRDLMDTRGTETGRGRGKDPGRDGSRSEMRFLLNMPQRLINMIRAVYPYPDETDPEKLRNMAYLRFDRKFYRKFAKQHPEFKVPRKI